MDSIITLVNESSKGTFRPVMSKCRRMFLSAKERIMGGMGARERFSTPGIAGA